jgi:hypothetical protein
MGMTTRCRSDIPGLLLLAQAGLGTLTACRFGGPSADPEAYVYFPVDASDAPEASNAMDASVGASPTIDAGSVPAAEVGDVASEPSASGFDDGGFGDGHASCSDAASSVATCDPVHNAGCNALEQCDVNPTQTSKPTGRCVFNGGGTDAGSCSISFVSESCPPKSTCVGGACRQLCACDTDCNAGDCCTDATGPQGFLLCHPCP